jgi:hypothetical protein
MIAILIALSICDGQKENEIFEDDVVKVHNKKNLTLLRIKASNITMRSTPTLTCSDPAANDPVNCPAAFLGVSTIVTRTRRKQEHLLGSKRERKGGMDEATHKAYVQKFVPNIAADATEREGAIADFVLECETAACFNECKNLISAIDTIGDIDGNWVTTFETNCAPTFPSSS